MFDVSAHLDRLRQFGLQVAARVRPLHFAIAAAAAVVAGGVAVVSTFALPGPQPVLAAERLQIQVVPPVEPAVRPGAVMEVGNLVDGFVPVRPSLSVIETGVDRPWDTYVETSEPPWGTKQAVGRTTLDAPPQPGEPTVGPRGGRVSRWFGFDAPERDYRAEREARRARLEARVEPDRDRSAVRRYSSEAAVDRPD